MMRELKFRVWHPDDYRIYYFSNFAEIVDWQRGDEYRLENEEGRMVNYMQYTGLKDRNGVEIFEGDIVEYIDGEYSFVGVVKNSIFGLYARDDKDNYKFEDFADENTMTAEVKILGNIYENKDLIEVE